MFDFIDDMVCVQILAMADLGGEFSPPEAVVAWVLDQSQPPSDDVLDWFAAQNALAEEAAVLNTTKVAPAMSPTVVLAEGFPRWADQWWVMVLGMPWAGNLRRAVDEARGWL